MVVCIIKVLISLVGVVVVSIIEVLIRVVVVSIIKVLIRWGCGGQYYRSVKVC